MQQYILSTKFLWIHAEKQGFAFHYILLGTFASDFTPISFFCDTFGNWKLLGFYYFNNFTHSYETHCACIEHPPVGSKTPD